MTDVKYPDVEVTLVGEDGNAFAILGRCSAALRAAGYRDAEVAEFMEQATSDDYNHLLRTCLAYFDIC